ncbi:MAG: hypothetical protein GXP27_08045 [Planctomycetes bacterium]|nr:hypothetical protein [Planctomycetota bacterium]
MSTAMPSKQIAEPEIAKKSGESNSGLSGMVGPGAERKMMSERPVPDGHDLVVDQQAGQVVYWTDAPQNARLAGDLRQLGFSVRVIDSLDPLRTASSWAEAIVVLDIEADVSSLPSAPNESLDELQRTLQEMVRQQCDRQVLVFAHRPAALARLSRWVREEWFHTGLAGIFERPRAAATLASHLRLAQERLQLLRQVRQARRERRNRLFEMLLGTSAPMRKLYGDIETVATAGGHVLIEGEAGTGKKLIAQVLHEASQRSEGPFVRVDCRSTTSRRLQTDLFGRRSPSSFSEVHGGEADGQDKACLSLAEEGTLVLTNIEALSLALQRRLRRHLQSSSLVLPSGSAPRIVATSRCDLSERVARGQFDRELHSLLTQHRLFLPPLRERPEDVLVLTRHFLREWGFREGRPAKQLAPDALRALREYSWPGNVRELREVLENVCSLERGPVLTAAAFQPWLAETLPDFDSMGQGMSLKEMERRLIESTFWRFGGNRERTARCLHIGVRTLSGKLREYGYPPRGGPGSNRRVA